MADPSKKTAVKVVLEGGRAWFFQEFWVLLMFGGFFLLTMCVPLVMTGFLTLQGILIGIGLLTALILTLTIPKGLPPFLLLLSLLVFLVQPQAWQKGTMIALLFIPMMLTGMVWFSQRRGPKSPADIARH